MSDPMWGRNTNGGTEGIDVLAVGDPVAEQTLDALGPEQFDVTVEPRHDGALERLETEDFDCVLSGTSFGQQTLSDVFAGVRERTETTPFVVVTDGAWAEIEPIEDEVSEIIVRGGMPAGRETAYITNRLRQAIRASRRLEACERALDLRTNRLDEFATVVSHDLRNPLNVARSAVELLDGDQEQLDRLDRSLHRMNAIIANGITFARQRDTVDGTAPADLETFATDLWADRETEHATLTTDAGGPIVADPDRLRELLGQLLDNAIEHGDPPVTVTVGTFEDGFYVADTGPGVPDRARERAFEPGVSTTQGTGLGLAIVREIARAHGWTVSLADSESGGTRIEVTGVEFY
jgi:signal transduction histidine kinase